MNMRKVKRILDEFLAAMSLIILSPVMVIAAVGIKLSSKGTVFYKAKRMGKDLKQITVYKFRTMYMGSDKKSMITAVNDNRIFAWGEILRKTKIDELPQLLNVLEGSMSIIGPRPEDISIVDNYFTDEEKKTLDVLPGLASPGSIFNYTHGDLYLKGNNANEVYVKEFLHIKLALDLYYLSHWSLWYDMKIIVRTLYTIVMMSFTSKQLGYQVEYKKVFRLSVFSEEK